jgi:peptide/nickel transport system substrate-binding protein
LVALVAAAGVVAGTATPAPAQSASSSATPTAFTWADTQEPSSLNPLVGYEGTDYVFWAMNYNLPIEFSAADFSPDLEHSIVTSVDASSDGMTFTYHLRPGMKWSDGQPFTASDMAWTLNFYKKWRIANYTADLSLMDTATATDATTVVITSTQPTSFYSGKTVFMYDYILPEHIWGKYENDPKGAKQLGNAPSVGSGPYIIKDYKRGQSVTLVKNPYYWGTTAGLTPTYDKLVYVIYNNEDAEASALQNGEIDFGYFNSANILNSLKTGKDIAVRGGQIPKFEEIGINTGSAYQTNPAGGFKPHGDGAHALTDPIVRRAIRQAVDNQTIVEKVLLGYGAVGDSPVQPTATTGNWDPTPAEALPFDLSAANQKLDAAGYTMGPDGVRIDPSNGKPLEFRYYTRNSDQNTIETAPFVKDWLSQIGIKLDILTASDAKLETLIEAGTYDLFDWDWFPNPDPNYILGIFTCIQRPPRAGIYKNSDSYYCNPRYDALFAKQATAVDPSKRADIVHEMQAILYQDSPYVVMYYSNTLEAYRTDRVTGFTPQPADTSTTKGDLLATYGPFSFISIRPAVGSSGGAAAKGASAGLWIAGAIALIVLGAVLVLVRRRRAVDDEERA